MRERERERERKREREKERERERERETQVGRALELLGRLVPEPHAAAAAAFVSVRQGAA